MTVFVVSRTDVNGQHYVEGVFRCNDTAQTWAINRMFEGRAYPFLLWNDGGLNRQVQFVDGERWEITETELVCEPISEE